ncbi:hypothetical protein FS842_000420 [Serendipita sp. 407]|nr:hypothetical protein FS842_000420 [Serendipita sp. 407]
MQVEEVKGDERKPMISSDETRRLGETGYRGNEVETTHMEMKVGVGVATGRPGDYSAFDLNAEDYCSPPPAAAQFDRDKEADRDDNGLTSKSSPPPRSDSHSASSASTQTPTPAPMSNLGPTTSDGKCQSVKGT